jgi:chromosome segregation ATPase
VIAWLKDLEGRYLHINRRYAADLNTSAERLRGRADSELPARETVDGPRRQYADDGLEEPLQLEYSIPAFEARPTLTALRFAVRALDGQPVGICGVAAPMNEARLAHEEAARLMEIERGSRLGSAAMPPEPLEKWEAGTEAADAPGVDSGPAWAKQLEDELEASRARAEQAEADAAHFRHDHVEGELEAARARAEQAEADAARFRVEVEAELEAARARAEQAEADAARFRMEVDGELEAARARAAQAEADATHFREMAERASQELLAISSRVASDAEPELAGELADHVGALQQELQQTRAELEQARAEGRAAQEEIRGELERTRAEARASQQDAYAELEEARAEVRATHEELVTAVSEREQAREEREQARTEAERSRLAAAEARTAAIAAQEELEAARIGHAQATAELTDRLRQQDTRIDSLHAPVAHVSGLSADLQRAIASERERGDELTRALDQLVARLADLEPAE